MQIAMRKMLRKMEPKMQMVFSMRDHSLFTNFQTISAKKRPSILTMIPI